MRQGAPPAQLRDLADTYLLQVRANGVKTADRIKNRLDEALGLIGQVPAKQVRSEDIERLKVKLAQGPRRESRSPASINRYLQDLKAVFRLAVRSGVLDRSPFSTVSLLTENNRRVRELSLAEEGRLMLSLPLEPVALRPFMTFAIATGARAGELSRLEWRHISERDQLARLPETKSGQAQQLVLSTHALGILRGLPRFGTHVFAWPDGRSFSLDYVSHAFARAASKAKIEDVRLHDCRHTFATRLRRAGADLPVLSQLLRHASTRMTERYAHVSRLDLRQAVEAANFAMRPAPESAPSIIEEAQA
jgi:integrase